MSSLMLEFGVAFAILNRSLKGFQAKGSRNAAGQRMGDVCFVHIYRYLAVHVLARSCLFSHLSILSSIVLELC